MVGISSMYIMIILLCLGGNGYESAQTHCPTNCSCLAEYAECSRKEFIKLPTDVPFWINKLYVFFAIVCFVYLLSYPFSFRYLNNNKIQTLDRSILGELKQLTVLKLNRNKISHIRIETFKRQEELITLYVVKYLYYFFCVYCFVFLES